MADTLRCIACQVPLENIMKREGGIQPVDGLAFTTGGHYGSTIFDPMDGSHLIVVVCDVCLADAAGCGIVWEVQAQRPRRHRAKSWSAPTPAPADTEEA